MLKFLICEDEPIHQQALCALLESVDIGQPFKTDICETGTELLEFFKGETKYDVLFLDVRLGQENGLEIAKRIRRNNEKLIIVITTTIMEYAMEGYEVDALAFLLKPIEREKFITVINRIKSKLKSTENNKHVFMKQGKKVVVNLDKVTYMESFGRKTCLYFDNGSSEEFYHTITVLEKELSGKQFNRCHRSYIVNIEQVKSVNKKKVMLKNGVELPVSESNHKKLYDTYTRYMLEG